METKSSSTLSFYSMKRALNKIASLSCLSSWIIKLEKNVVRSSNEIVHLLSDHFAARRTKRGGKQLYKKQMN